MKTFMNPRAVVFLLLSLMLLLVGLATAQDLTQQKSEKVKQIGEVDAKMKSATADEYPELSKQREKLVAELTDINKKLMSDAKAVEKINSSKRAYNAGLQSLKLAQYTEAVANFDKAISFDQTFFKAYYAKGLALKKDRKISASSEAYKQAIELNPNYTVALIALGKNYSQTGQSDMALSTLNKAVTSDATSAKAYYALAEVYQSKKKNYKLAAQNFTKATQINPEYDKAFYSLGVSLTELSRYEEALLAFENGLAVTKKRRWADPHFRMAVVYNKQGKFSQAKKAAMDALTQKKKYAAASYEAGKASKGLGQYAEALTYFGAAAQSRVWRKAAEYEIDLIQNRHKYGGN